MSSSAVIRWNASGSKQVTTLASPRWAEVRQGLVLSLVGQPLALLLGFAGLVLLAAPTGLLATRLGQSQEDAVYVGWMLVGGGLMGWVMVLVGQLRCLTGATHAHGARDLLYACLHCTLAVPGCFAIAHFLGGSVTFAALERGPVAVLELELVRGCTVIQMVGIVLALGVVLLSAAFARALFCSLNDVSGTRGVTCYFWFVAFMLGATGGLILQVGRTAPKGTYYWLGLAWLLCLIWHALIVCGAIRRITRFLNGERLTARSKASPAKPKPMLAQPSGQMPTIPGQVVLQAAAFLPRTK